MATAELRAEALLTVREESYLQIVWRRFRRHRVALFGAAILMGFILIAALAPWIAPYDPYAQNLNLKNAGPSPAHWLGTDELGRDVLSRLMHAARISLTVAFVVTLISQTTGALIGAISGYFGGWVDNLIQRIVDFMLTLPLLPLLLTISALLSDVTIPGLSREWSSVVIIIIVLSVFGWMGAARLVRGVVLSLREQMFTEAARALGMSRDVGPADRGAPHDPQRHGPYHRQRHPQPGHRDHPGGRPELPGLWGAASGAHLGQHAQQRPGGYVDPALQGHRPRVLHFPDFAFV